MRVHDLRTFNIADAGGGAPPAGNASIPGGSPAGEGAGGAGGEGGGDGGSSPAQPPAFTNWTEEAITTLVPEGYEITPEQSTRMLTIVNEAQGDPSKVVSGMLKFYTEIATQSGEALANEYNETQTAWQNEMRADPDYGGDKFDESLRVAKEVGLKIGGDGFMQLLRTTGAGNSVHMLRALNEVAKYLPKEGTPVGGRPSAQPKSLADRMFGSKT